LEIHLFGPLEVRLAGQPLPRLRSRKGRWLLALLLLRHGAEVERAWLAGNLWPDSNAFQALTYLRHSLRDLRRALGTRAWRVHSPSRQMLALDTTDARVDVVAFDRAIARGDTSSLAEAVSLYRGPLLEGCTEEWVVQERSCREQAYLQALETLAADACSRGEAASAEGLLRRAVAVDPLRESAQRALMEVLASGGNYSAATQIYRELRALLHRELNSEPDPVTTAVYERFRAEARSRAATGARAEFPPLRSLEAFAHNLPVQLTRFIGREPQIAEVKRLLQGARLLTLTGAGGSGKTRLALQLAADLLPEYEDGVWFVELAALAEPGLVLQTVAITLGVREEPDRPLTVTLLDHLRSRSLLLVLDNCEHLLSASARLAADLLRGCPCLRILATSREGLGIAGEQTYRVPSLSAPGPSHLPSVQQLQEFEAVRLFVDRALLSQPEFAVTTANAWAVVQVCQQLDGIPLAIELAAARLKALPVEQISARLDNRFRLLTGGSRTALPRHQTLRALIDWSYDLLSEPERTLLQRLSVFAGGWTLEAAEAVCADGDTEEWGVMDLLTALVEKSLVQYEEREGEARYRLLETVRQYALDRLLHAGEEPVVRERHLRYFLQVAEEQYRKQWQREASWWVRLDTERDNLRAALEWTVGQGNAPMGLRLCVAVWLPLWHRPGYLTEGRESLATVLSLPGAEERTQVRATVLMKAGEWASQQGDSSEARRLLEESLSIRRELGGPAEVASCLAELGVAAREQNDYRRARSLLEESIRIYEELGRRWDVAHTQPGLGSVLCLQGDYEAAKTLLEDALPVLREMGGRFPMDWCLHHLAEVAYARGDLAGAQRLLDESRKVPNRSNYTSALNLLARLAQLRGDWEHAAALCRESLARSRPRRYTREMARSLYLLGRGEIYRGDLEAARTLLAESVTLYQVAGRSLGVAECLESLASLATAEGEPLRAARCLGAAEALRDAAGAPLPPSERPEYVAIITAIRAGCSEEMFAAAWTEGRAMSLEEALREALAEEV
jgi:non-specific serine/threonine protein kinase